MPFGKYALLLDLQYSAWADRRVLAACCELTLQELERDLGISHRSVIQTLQHMYVSQEFWLGCLHKGVLPPLDAIGEPEEPVTEVELARDTLQRKWPELWVKALAWFDGLSDEELAVELSCRMGDGRELRFARWQLLRHMVNHSTLHRGQVIGMMRMLGKTPPNGDLIGVYISGQMASAITRS